MKYLSSRSDWSRKQLKQILNKDEGRVSVRHVSEDYLQNFPLLKVSVGVFGKNVNGKICSCAYTGNARLQHWMKWNGYQNSLSHALTGRLRNLLWNLLHMAACGRKKPAEKHHESHDHHIQTPSKKQDIMFCFFSGTAGIFKLEMKGPFPHKLEEEWRSPAGQRAVK